MKTETISLLLLLVGFVSCLPTRRPGTQKYGTDYYKRLNLDKFKTSDVYGQRVSEGTARGSFATDAGQRDDGINFAEAKLSGGVNRNSTFGIGVREVHAGGDVIASGQTNLTTKLERGSDFVQGKVDGHVNGSLHTVGAVGSSLQGSSQFGGEGDVNLSARGGFAEDSEGSKSADAELMGSGKGKLRSDIDINGFSGGGNIDTSGDGKVSGSVGHGSDDSGAYVGGNLETEGRGKFNVDGGVGEYNGQASVDGTGRGNITASASYGQTENDIHGGGEINASGRGNISSSIGVGSLQGDLDIQGSGDGDYTVGGEIGRDDNSIHAGSVVKATGQGDIYSQFGVGDYRGEGHLHGHKEDEITAGVGASRDEDGVRARGEITVSKEMDISSQTRFGDHFGHSSMNGAGDGKLSTGVELTSNDTAGHANSHLGGGVGGNAVNNFGIDGIHGRTDTSGGIRGNITGDAVIYSDETGIHGNAEGKAIGKVGVSTSGNIGNIYGTSNAGAKEETKFGVKAEVVNNDDGVRMGSRVGASNQGAFLANTELGSSDPGGLVGYGNVNGDTGSNVNFTMGFGENTNNTLFAGSQIVGTTGGKTSGSVGIQRNILCHEEDGNECSDERVVFAEGEAEGKGKISATAGVSRDQDDNIVAADEIGATGHGKLSGGAGIGNVQSSGDIDIGADGKVYSSAGLATDDAGGVQAVAEKGAKGKANINTNARIGSVDAHGGSIVEGDGKVFTGINMSKDRENGVHVISDIGSEATGNLNSSAAISGVEGKSSVGGTGGSKVTILGDYVRHDNGSTHGKGEVLTQGEGKVGVGVELNGVHGEGAVSTSGHGGVSAEADMHRSETGNITAQGEVGGSLGGSLSADGAVGELRGGTGISAGAEGKIKGEFSRSKEHGAQGNIQTKVSTSSGFRLRFWG